jgi:hypothetical protein
MHAALYRARRLVAILCLAALLVAALAPASSGVLDAILIPLWLFFAVLLAFQATAADERPHRTRLSPLPVFSSRPPPAR